MKRALALPLLLTAACASTPKSADAPASAAPAAEAAPGTYEYAPTSQPAAPASTDNLQFNLTDWQTQFDQSLADTDRLDCPNACRALGSLERSAGSICGITGASSSTCQDVQKKRDDAQARVAQRCGPCR